MLSAKAGGKHRSAGPYLWSNSIHRQSGERGALAVSETKDCPRGLCMWSKQVKTWPRLQQEDQQTCVCVCVCAFLCVFLCVCVCRWARACVLLWSLSLHGTAP